MDFESGEKISVALQFGLVRLRRGDDLEVFPFCFIAMGIGHVGEIGFYSDVPRRPKCQGQRLGENVPGSDRVEDELRIKLGNLCDNLPKVRLIRSLRLVEGDDGGDVRAGNVQVGHPCFTQHYDLSRRILGSQRRQHG